MMKMMRETTKMTRQQKQQDDENDERDDENDKRDDYCWLVQFEGIFNAELHPAQPANKPANEKSNKPKIPKISFTPS